MLYLALEDGEKRLQDRILRNGTGAPPGFYYATNALTVRGELIRQLSDEMKKQLVHLMHNLRKSGTSGNFAHVQNLHLTLRFIGEYSEPDFIAEQMAQIPFAPFPLTLGGWIGNFGDLLWAGVSHNDAHEKYVKQLTRSLAGCGIPYDKKRFHPYITLLRNAASMQPFSDIVIAKESMTVRRISLMRSDFGKHGAQYTEIAYVDCQGDA